MARYPGAIWRDVGAPGRFSNGTMQAHLGVVLHVNDAQSDDLFGWITGDNGMSCHFQVNKAGKVYQYIDTAYSSWCQKDGNNTYLSIESQGLGSEKATQAQIDAIGGILAWANKVHGIPLQLAEAPGQRGFGWHGMGDAHGADWGHPNCPGARKDQRGAMLAAAKGTPTPTGGLKMDAEVEAKFAHLEELIGMAIRGDKGDGPETHPDNLNTINSRLGAISPRLDAIEATLKALAQK